MRKAPLPLKEYQYNYAGFTEYQKAFNSIEDRYKKSIGQQ